MISACSCGVTWVHFELMLACSPTTAMMIRHWASGHTVKVAAAYVAVVKEMATKLAAIKYTPPIL